MPYEKKYGDMRLFPSEVSEKGHSRKYRPDDPLSAAQAAEVISENSQKSISPRALANLVARGRIPEPPKFGRLNQYPYKDVCDIVVVTGSIGRPRRPDDEVKPSALYQRDYKRRRIQEAAGSAG